MEYLLKSHQLCDEMVIGMGKNCTEVAESWAHKCGVFGAGNQIRQLRACAHFVHLPLQTGCVRCLLAKQTIFFCVCVMQKATLYR